MTIAGATLSATDVVGMAHDTTYALAGYMFSRDNRKALRTANTVEAGWVLDADKAASALKLVDTGYHRQTRRGNSGLGAQRSIAR